MRPGEAEIAAEMGIGLEEYQQLLGDLKGLEIGTLHIERNEDSGEEELAYVPGRPEEDPLFRCLRGELEERLAEAIANLPDRERLVMTLYYYEEMTMREIGLALGVVESRVSQVHASAVVHLRAALRTWPRAALAIDCLPRPPPRDATERQNEAIGTALKAEPGAALKDFWHAAKEPELTEKTLKQNEIDALFEAARSASPEAPHTEVRARVVPYNFSSAGQISTDQLRAISMLNDLFARNLTHNLAAWLRTRFQVNLVSAEQIQFNEFLLRIPEISYVASVRLEPLGALSVLQLDLGLAPPIIDLLLGGDGKDGPLRELTDIEESILGSVVEIVCRELTVAWQQVGLSFNLRSPPDADPGGAHYRRDGKDALSELRNAHAA